VTICIAEFAMVGVLFERFNLFPRFR